MPGKERVGADEALLLPLRYGRGSETTWLC